MNGQYNPFIYRLLYAQQLLNKALTKRKINNWSMPCPQLLFWPVEILLRVYISYYQYIYILIHQFNKKTMGLQRFKLSPCDGIEASDPLYRFVPTFPIIVQLIGGICQSVLCRGQFPALLQHFPHLVFLRLDLRVRQQYQQVIRAKRECVRAYALHDVKYKLVYLYLQPVAVAADNLLQGFGMQQRWGEPHTAFLFGGETSVLQEMEKSWYLRFQLLQEIGIIGLQAVYLAYPIACFPSIYDDGQVLVVGTQHELGEEGYLVTVFTFGFHLVG